MSQIQTVDDYIAAFPPEIQKILLKIRKMIKDAAPDAVEQISYQMPGYKLAGKPLIYFAAFQKHIGIYPSGDPLSPLSEELSTYRTSKGTLQFPLKQPIPYPLIKKVIKCRIAEIEKSISAR